MFHLLVFAGVRPSGAGNHKVNHKTSNSETAAPAAWFNMALHLTSGRLRRPLAGERQGVRRTMFGEG
jgi:hypothetical protein